MLSTIVRKMYLGRFRSWEQAKLRSWSTYHRSQLHRDNEQVLRYNETLGCTWNLYVLLMRASKGARYYPGAAVAGLDMLRAREDRTHHGISYGDLTSKVCRGDLPWSLIFYSQDIPWQLVWTSAPCRAARSVPFFTVSCLLTAPVMVTLHGCHPDGN